MFKKGVTFDTQPPQLIFVLNFKVFIVFKFIINIKVLLRLSLKLFRTTDTLLKAIAIPAIIGSNKNPFTGYKTPAAIGIPMRL